MKPYLFIPIIMIVTFILQQFLPWWILTVVCFLTCFIFNVRLFAGFAGSLLAVFVLWVTVSILADQYFDVAMSSLLGGLLGKISPSAVYLLTGLIGGLTAGFSGLLGSWTKLLIYRN